MRHLLLRIIVFGIIATLFGCLNRPIDFNFKGKSILYVEQDIMHRSLIYYNFSNHTEYRISDINPWDYGEFQLIDSNGKIAAFRLLENDNVLTLIDLKSNTISKLAINNLLSLDPVCQLGGITANNDSVLVLSGSTKNIYVYSLKEKKLLTKINLLNYGIREGITHRICCSSHNVLTGMCDYKDESIKYSNYSTLFVYDIKNKIFQKLKLPHYYVGNWSPDGTKITICDSAYVPSLIYYPEVKIKKLAEMFPDSLTVTSESFFIENNTLIFLAKKSAEPEKEYPETQLYMLSFDEKPNIKQLTSTPSNKIIFDVRP